MVSVRDEDILAYDMFAGDETPVTVFSDKMVVTRKAHQCVICGDPIPAATRVRARTERDDDDKVVATFYACPLCCQAMAISWSDNGDAITARYSLRRADA